MPPIISIETTLLDKANFLLQNANFYSHHHWLYTFDCKYLCHCFHTQHCRHCYPLSNCAYICCLVSINIQQLSMNVNRCNFFYMKKFSNIPPLCTHFHIKFHFAICNKAKKYRLLVWILNCLTARKLNNLKT